jgi:hypothetical protein
MSDMETGRKAGGAGPAFTAAVLIALLLIAGLLVWRLLPASTANDGSSRVSIQESKPG